MKTTKRNTTCIVKDFCVTCISFISICVTAQAQENAKFDVGDIIIEKHIPYSSEQVERTKLMYPYSDFERFPPVTEYSVDTTKITPMRVGDIIPDEILDIPLQLVNHPQGIKSATLREMASTRFLVLDFWANWCKPCIESMNKWESKKKEISADITVLGVHMDYDYRAESDARKRGWTSVQIVGREAKLLAYYFTQSDRVAGPSVWIKDGTKFLGVSSAKNIEYDYISALISGEVIELPVEARWVGARYK